MTLMESAKQNQVRKEFEEVAKYEEVSVDFIMKGVASGEIVIPKNINRSLKIIRAVGKGLKTKINANIGTSPDHISIKEEIEKMNIAVKYGTDAVMDLSTGGNLINMRKDILEKTPVMVGTVPIYQVASQTVRAKKKITQMDSEMMFDVVEQQAQEGVDFMTIHCGVNCENRVFWLVGKSCVFSGQKRIFFGNRQI